MVKHFVQVMLASEPSLRDYELSSYFFSQWFDMTVVPKGKGKDGVALGASLNSMGGTRLQSGLHSKTTGWRM